MGSHVNYSVKGIDISIPFRGFPFSTSSAPSVEWAQGFQERIQNLMSQGLGLMQRHYHQAYYLLL